MTINGETLGEFTIRLDAFLVELDGVFARVRSLRTAVSCIFFDQHSWACEY